MRYPTRLILVLVPSLIVTALVVAGQSPLAPDQRQLQASLRAKALSPTDPLVSLALAETYIRLGRYQEARAEAAALAALCPREPNVMRLRGLIAEHSRDFREARRQYEAALRETDREPTRAWLRERLNAVRAHLEPPGSSGSTL